MEAPKMYIADYDIDILESLQETGFSTNLSSLLVTAEPVETSDYDTAVYNYTNFIICRHPDDPLIIACGIMHVNKFPNANPNLYVYDIGERVQTLR